MKLKERVSIVTGAGKGIGRGISLSLAEEGACTIVADIDFDNARRVADEVERAGGRSLPIRVDVTREAEVNNMVEVILREFGRVDILVNNAGIYLQADAVEIAEEDWDRILAVNLKGVFLCTKYCIPEMIKGGGGSIVNIGSEAGIVGIGDQVAYNVSKSGVISLTKSTAIDFAPHNIRVNCVCPGRTLTPLVEKVIAEAEYPEGKRRVLSEDRPLKRMGRSEEIAAGVMYLASDESLYATGSILSIDGGYTAQ